MASKKHNFDTLNSASQMLPDVDIFPNEDQPRSSRRVERVLHLCGPLEDEESSRYTAARTLGDGACGLHSCWGDVVERDSDDPIIAMPDPRAELHRRLEAVSAVRLTQMLGLSFGALFESTCSDLVGRARQIVRGQDGLPEREINFVWNALPGPIREDFISDARARVQAEERRSCIQDHFLSACEGLFQPQYEPLVRQLCLDLTYVTEMDMPRLGTVASDVTHDPADLRLFDRFLETVVASAPSSSGDDASNAPAASTHALSRYDVLFAERPESDAHRMKFFLQNALPGKRHRVPSVLQTAEKNARVGDEAAVLQQLRTACVEYFEALPERRYPESLNAARLWRSLTLAWSEADYWFDVEELQFIMTLVEKPVAFYVYDSGVFQKRPGLFFQGSGGQPVRVVYDGGRRGHFSRLLSAEEWEELDHRCHTDSEDGGESTSHTGSCDDSESSTSSENSQPESGAEATPTEQPPVPPITLAAAEPGLEESADEWEDASDISDNSDIFHVEVEIEKPFITAEDRWLARCERLAALLRDHPLLPLHPGDTSTAYTDVNSGRMQERESQV